MCFVDYVDTLISIYVENHDVVISQTTSENKVDNHWVLAASLTFYDQVMPGG